MRHFIHLDVACRRERPDRLQLDSGQKWKQMLPIVWIQLYKLLENSFGLVA